MDKTTIYYTPTLRFHRSQLLSDFLAGFLLLLAGIDGLSTPDQHVHFPWLSIIVGGAAVLLIIFEWRKTSIEEGQVIRWVDIIVGVVLFVEALNKYKSWKGFQPAYGYFLISLWTFAKGLLHSKMPKRRKIVFDESGFMSRTGPFRSLKLRWDEIASIHAMDAAMEFTLTSGKTARLNMDRIQNRKEIIHIMSNYAAQRSINVDAVPSPV